MSYIETAKECVLKGGEILVNNLGNIKNIFNKNAFDIATNLDIEVENEIKSIIQERYPNHNIIAEESDILDNQSDFTWYIDPLSCTLNYVHQLPFFSVDVALMKNNQILVGAVFDPRMEELFSAEKGFGANLNGKSISVSSNTDLMESVITMILDKSTEEALRKSRRLFDRFFPITNIRIIGSTALHLCYVACGRSEAFMELYSDIFSTPAGKIILEESGGKVTDFSGDNWTCDSPNVFASNGKIHTAALAYLK
jgi:myo-inositol-1(or 4)-monophosphatase